MSEKIISLQNSAGERNMASAPDSEAGVAMGEAGGEEGASHTPYPGDGESQVRARYTEPTMLLGVRVSMTLSNHEELGTVTGFTFQHGELSMEEGEACDLSVKWDNKELEDESFPCTPRCL